MAKPTDALPRSEAIQNLVYLCLCLYRLLDKAVGCPRVFDPSYWVR